VAHNNRGWGSGEKRRDGGQATTLDHP